MMVDLEAAPLTSRSHSVHRRPGKIPAFVSPNAQFRGQFCLGDAVRHALATVVAGVALLGAVPAAAQVRTIISPTFGAVPAVDPIADLRYKSEFSINSWYFVGHFKADGQVLDYLYHVMSLRDPKSGRTSVEVAFSLTDETTNKYVASDVIVPMSVTGLSATGLDVRVPEGNIVGTLDALRVKANMPGGAIDLSLSVVSPVLYNAGTAQFPLLDMVAQEYSIPHFATRGTITFGSKTYQVDGDTWFDRQFQNYAAVGPQSNKWTWMDLNLDNGDSISLWTFTDRRTSLERAWATILHQDGTQTTTAIEPTTKSQADIWESRVTGQRYPSRWRIKIPEFAAELDVIASPKQQELVPSGGHSSRLEAASSVQGTFLGKPVHGYGYVELVGKWR